MQQSAVEFRCCKCILVGVPPIPDTDTNVCLVIGIGMSLGYRYDKNPHIGIRIGMKWNPDIGIGMIEKS